MGILLILIDVMIVFNAIFWPLWLHGPLMSFFFFFFFTKFIPLLLFHPGISKNIPKLVLFMLYQGVWGLQHTVKSALQPLVFIHVIDIRCYETDVADCYA